MVVHEFDDQINIFKVFRTLWKEKILISIVTGLFAISSIVYSLLVTEIYKSQSTLVLRNELISDLGSQRSNMGGLGGLANNLSSLTNLGLDSSGTKTDYALVRLNSFDFFEQYIYKNLASELFATKGWDRSTGKMVYNDKLYSIETSSWKTNSFGETFKPSPQEAYRIFKRSLSVQQDKKTKFITIGFNSISPILANQVVETMIVSINKEMHTLDSKAANEMLLFLEDKIKEAEDNETRNVILSLLSDQYLKVALTIPSDHYFLLPAVSPLVPEKRSYPERTLIVLISTFFGGVLACCFVILKSSYAREK